MANNKTAVLVCENCGNVDNAKRHNYDGLNCKLCKGIMIPTTVTVGFDMSTTTDKTGYSNA